MAAMMAHGEGDLRMTGEVEGARRPRAGITTAAVATALLVAVCGGPPAGASPTPGRAVAGRGYLYWSNTLGSIAKPGNGVIVRANLNGTGANQQFITGGSFPDAITVGPQYLYWTNQNSDAIGRARLNGTGVNQAFVGRKDFRNLHGIAVGPGGQ